jgi:HEPN domain-containing protein
MVKPPKGKRSVYSNNKFVGFVDRSDDIEEDSRLGKELLIEKGFWKEVSKLDSMLGQAQSFSNTANYVYEKDLLNFPRNPNGISPFVVNAAFSAEMYLKCLLEKHGLSERGHSLVTLFKHLPNKLKDRINKSKDILESQYEVEKGVLFKEHIKSFSNAFIEWRYIYESGFNHISIPSVILVLHVLHEICNEEIKNITIK